MSLPLCVSLPFFNMADYVREKLKLSVVSYVCQAPDTGNLRIDRHHPLDQTTEGWCILAALHKWAADTDCGGVIRNSYAKQLWAERDPGETVIYLDKLLLRTPCNLSL